jgi:hypothetical protein
MHVVTENSKEGRAIFEGRPCPVCHRHLLVNILGTWPTHLYTPYAESQMQRALHCPAAGRRVIADN